MEGAGRGLGREVDGQRRGKTARRANRVEWTVRYSGREKDGVTLFGRIFDLVVRELFSRSEWAPLAKFGVLRCDFE